MDAPPSKPSKDAAPTPGRRPREGVSHHGPAARVATSTGRPARHLGTFFQVEHGALLPAEPKSTLSASPWRASQRRCCSSCSSAGRLMRISRGAWSRRGGRPRQLRCAEPSVDPECSVSPTCWAGQPGSAGRGAVRRLRGDPRRASSWRAKLRRSSPRRAAACPPSGTIRRRRRRAPPIPDRLRGARRPRPSPHGASPRRG